MRTEDLLDRNTLIEDIEMARENWDERSQFKLAGVGNLSNSDLDTLELYAKEYNGYNLMEPMGNIKLILKKYNVIR